MRFLLLLFFMLIPFSYFQLYGVRLLLLQISVGLFIVVWWSVKNRKSLFYFDSSMFLLLLLNGLVLLYAFFSGYVNELLAMSVFITLYFVTTQIDSKFVLDLIRFYKYAVFFTASGVVMQFLVHKLTGLVIFRYQQFGGGRNAYSFIWEDYSFISLFIASAIPLLYKERFNFRFLFYSLFLILASLITSARTGVAALILFIFFYLVCEFLKAFILGKIKKTIIIITVFSFFLPLIIVKGLEFVTGRELTSSSSGRLDGFVVGYEFFKERMLFGFMFDKDLYNQLVAAVPHNVFIYMLFMGGIFSFVIFIAWVISVVIKIKSSDRKLLAALCICFLGVQFIPSFFSAYYLAILLGIAMVSSRANRNSAIMR